MASPPLELTIHPPPTPPTALLSLPRELRDIIYALVLLQPPKYSRRHLSSCLLSPRTCTVFERPLFTYPRQRCACVKRTGLSLLVANRQIYGEAARMFWEGNVHCFDLVTDFTRDVGSLREETRVWIRRVSVLGTVSPDHMAMVPTRVPMALRVPPWCHALSEFWATVKTCTRLAELEVQPPGYGWAAQHYDFMGDVALALPELKLSWVTMTRLDVGKDSQGVWMKDKELQTLYCMSRREVDVRALVTAREVKDSIRDFETNFLVHAKYALYTQLLGHGPGVVVSSVRGGDHKLADGLDDRCAEQTLRLRDGTTATVQMYGLPLSAETRRRHARERYIRDVLLRKQGKPTPREEQFNEAIRLRRTERKSRREEQDEVDRKYAMGQRNIRRFNNSQDRIEREGVEKLEREEALRDSIQETTEVRLVERKRVSRTASPRST